VEQLEDAAHQAAPAVVGVAGDQLRPADRDGDAGVLPGLPHQAGGGDQPAVSRLDQREIARRDQRVAAAEQVDHPGVAQRVGRVVGPVAEDVAVERAQPAGVGRGRPAQAQAVAQLALIAGAGAGVGGHGCLLSGTGRAAAPDERRTAAGDRPGRFSNQFL
jgi:hypothetical protein